MAEDDQDRANESAAEREAEVQSELERVGEDPEQAGEGSENLGKQSADSGTTRDEASEIPGEPRPEEVDEIEGDEDEEDEEEADELQGEPQQEEWEDPHEDVGLVENDVDADADVSEAVEDDES